MDTDRALVPEESDWLFRSSLSHYTRRLECLAVPVFKRVLDALQPGTEPLMYIPIPEQYTMLPGVLLGYVHRMDTGNLKANLEPHLSFGDTVIVYYPDPNAIAQHGLGWHGFATNGRLALVTAKDGTDYLRYTWFGTDDMQLSCYEDKSHKYLHVTLKYSDILIMPPGLVVAWYSKPVAIVKDPSQFFAEIREAAKKGLDPASLLEMVEQEAEIVFTTRSGSKYHRDWCEYLASGKKRLSLREALQLGLKACEWCKPPPL